MLRLYLVARVGDTCFFTVLNGKSWMKILIIDDDQALCRSMQVSLDLQQHEVQTTFSAQAGREALHSFSPEVVFLDINLPDQSGLQTLPALVSTDISPAVIVMTGESDNLIAVQAMREGAFDYLRKPLDMDDIFAMLERVKANRCQPEKEGKARSIVEADFSQVNIVGLHPDIIDLHKKIGLLSRSTIPVLIQGESGTGKELAAQILHDARDATQPFVAINCSAVVPSLLESEFFGHERGAFTGADQLKIGKLEYAGQGTLFLDEIGDMPLDLQGKLLRVLQEGQFVRVGGLEPIAFQARFISATHWDLEKLIDGGRFRKDLFYRIAVSSLYLPPLRERLGDIPLLVDILLKRISRQFDCSSPHCTKEAIAKLLSYSWPGNIRELENALTRAMALTTEKQLAAADICFDKGQHTISTATKAPVTLAEAEKLHVQTTLNQLQWNISKTARQLAVSPTTLRKKITDYKLSNPWN